MRLTCKMLLSILLAVGLVSGCGNGVQTQTEQDRQAEDYARSFGVDATVSTRPDGTQSVVMENSAGGISTQAGSNLAVPASFPKDVPLYPQLNLISASELPNQGSMLQGQSSDSADQVAEFHIARMKDQGWTDQSAAAPSPAMRSLQFRKDNRTASINLITTDTGTTVQLMTSGG